LHLNRFVTHSFQHQRVAFILRLDFELHTGKGLRGGASAAGVCRAMRVGTDGGAEGERLWVDGQGESYMRRPPLPPFPGCGCVVEPGHCAEELAHFSCSGFMAAAGLLPEARTRGLECQVQRCLAAPRNGRSASCRRRTTGVGAVLTDRAEAEPARIQGLPSVVQSVRQFGRRVDYGCGYGGIWLLWAGASTSPHAGLIRTQERCYADRRNSIRNSTGR
jgi:hypothetical protein